MVEISSDHNGQVVILHRIAVEENFLISGLSVRDGRSKPKLVPEVLVVRKFKSKATWLLNFTWSYRRSTLYIRFQSP